MSIFDFPSWYCSVCKLVSECLPLITSVFGINRSMVYKEYLIIFKTCTEVLIENENVLFVLALTNQHIDATWLLLAWVKEWCWIWYWLVRIATLRKCFSPCWNVTHNSEFPFPHGGILCKKETPPCAHDFPPANILPLYPTPLCTQDCIKHPLSVKAKAKQTHISMCISLWTERYAYLRYYEDLLSDSFKT